MRPITLSEALGRLHILIILAMAGLFVHCGSPHLPAPEAKLSVNGGTAINAHKDQPDFFVRFYYTKKGGGENSTGRCSGTHVGYGVILTAAHCVISTAENGAVSENRLTRIEYKYFNGSDYEMRRHKFKPDGSDYTIRAHSNYEILPIQGRYKGAFLFDDIALIMTELDQDHERPIRGYAYLPTPAYITEAQIGGLVTIYGDGHLKDNKTKRYYGKVILDAKKYAGIYPNNKLLNDVIGGLSGISIRNMTLDELVIRNFSERLWQRKWQGERPSAVPTKLSFDARENTSPGYLRGICKGDSGGGSIKQWNNQSLVVGITSAAAMNLKCMRWQQQHCCQVGELVHVRAYIAWIGSQFQNQGLEWPPHGDNWDEFSVTATDDDEQEESPPKKTSSFPGCSS